MRQLVTFKEKKLQYADMDWADMQGVQLIVEEAGRSTLVLEIERQLEGAADYQLNEMSVEAAYQAEWVDENGRTHVRELIPASMWESV